MNYKWIGSIMIVAACGGTGFSIASNVRKEEAMLRQMRYSMEYMKSELQYRLTPLSQLCRQTAKRSNGIIRKLFLTLAATLEQQRFPEASDCMHSTIDSIPELPGSIRIVCAELGKSLGALDLNGQLQGLEHACEICLHRQKKLETHQQQRLHCYQTLGVCAGAALAILLI